MSLGRLPIQMMPPAILVYLPLSLAVGTPNEIALGYPNHLASQSGSIAKFRRKGGIGLVRVPPVTRCSLFKLIGSGFQSLLHLPALCLVLFGSLAFLHNVGAVFQSVSLLLALVAQTVSVTMERGNGTALFAKELATVLFKLAIVHIEWTPTTAATFAGAFLTEGGFAGWAMVARYWVQSAAFGTFLGWGVAVLVTEGGGRETTELGYTASQACQHCR